MSTERGALQEALCTSILWSRASKKEKLIVTSHSRCVSDPQENEEKKKRKHKQNEGWGCNLIGYGLLNMHTGPGFDPQCYINQEYVMCDAHLNPNPSTQ